MADVERIRRAIGEWPYFRDNPQDIEGEVENWIEAIVVGVRDGYQIVIINGEAAEELGNGSTITIPEAHQVSIELPVEDPSQLTDSALRDCALHMLEAASETLKDTGSEVMWLKYNEQAGRWDAISAFDELGY
ncbi:MAG: hypothetical protein A2785_02865 [Candidatus Chisholmbacteria bacterium RIFCSPHIGHO2_01_FULL_49_18]|uniref:Uncharacterized protein n=2 Tax=Candidatus Chisholmiibacteriota TaxID=1817900 RepID=A0A1G1VM91_9BACT|nr:MAG: hypothetical protein A2785_02865 [Candidatus Chisholmbacteria bacterium RIFCSPHIGHO2_01_FULL_49_18]OGY21028.1 MAG: hypothetical protein A3A65_01825 [Candidatus Chisholmbacteria bacterium RIFCSPLOWO2_01_FULL_49_14]